MLKPEAIFCSEVNLDIFEIRHLPDFLRAFDRAWSRQISSNL